MSASATPLAAWLATTHPVPGRGELTGRKICRMWRINHDDVALMLQLGFTGLEAALQAPNTLVAGPQHQDVNGAANRAALARMLAAAGAPDTPTALARLAAMGFTRADIAASFGLEYTAVYRLYRKYGVTPA